MTRELSYNVHPHVDEERLVNQWLTWQPRAVLVMNNPQFAMRLQALRPNALVIARQTPDDHVDDLGTPGDWMARMLALVPDPRVVLYAGNEIHGDPDIGWWTRGAMWLAAEHGRRLCILNCGTGGPEDEEWWAQMPATSPNTLPSYRIGGLEAVARAWAEGEHLLGLHEYADGLDWRRDLGWQVGRYERHLDTFQKMGITVPRDELRRRIVITEATFDSTVNSNWKGARHLPAAEAARQMIEQARQVYWDMPVCMFCKGHNSDPQWRMFRLDYAGDETVGLDDWGRDFQAIIGAYMTAGEGEVVDTQKMTVTVLQTTRKRAAPNLLATQTGSLAAGTYTLEVGEEVQTDGYCWRYFLDGDGSGWYSATGPLNDPQAYIALAVVVPDPDPEPEPEPEPEPTPDPMTAEKWLPLFQCWLDTLTAWEVQIAVQKEAIAAWETSVTALKGILRETIDGLVVGEE